MRKIIISGISMAILCFTSMGVQAENGQYAEGVAQLKNQKYEDAFLTLQPLVEQGDPRSVFQLAMMYHGGLEVEFNEAKAVELYKVAAEQGVVEAQEYLAAGYREGWWGLPMDYEKYRYWMDKAVQTHL